MKQAYAYWSGAVLILLITVNYAVQAQTGTIRGKVTDAESGKTIEYTSILNFSKHLRIYSNSNGEFNLVAQPGDTLVLYAVGYYYQKVIADKTMINTTEPESFTMNQQATEIDEVKILGLGTYDEFKKQFIDLNRPRTKTDDLTDNLAQVTRDAAREAYNKAKDEQKLDGVTLLTVPIRTPEEKERLVLAQIIKKEQIRDQIYQKFNPVVVKKVTGLTDDDTIIEFMVYCHYSDAYLLKVDQYELMVSIARKYEQFKKMKQEEESRQNLLERFDELYFFG